MDYHVQSGCLQSAEVQNTARRIVIDTETTGLDPETDELLRVSILDADTKRVLYNEYFRPERTKSWPEAEAVNHISPDMVADKPGFQTAVGAINMIMDKTETVIGYNPGFDIGFLQAYGVLMEDKEIIDVMEDYAQKYGEYDEDKGHYRWVKLTECAAALGYDWGREQAHDSLADCRTTLYCWKNSEGIAAFI